MTLKEAIKTNQQLQVDLTINLSDDHIRANQLGIEALKWRQESEQYDPSLSAFPLPGETKE